MIKIWKLTLFFLLCLVVALLFNVPIQQLLPRVELPDTVRVAGVDGTVMRGRAQQVSLNQFPLRDIEYRYMPSCIALLKVCYRIVYAQGTVQVAYDVLNGDTEVTRVKIEYPALELAQYVPDIPVKPDGRLELIIDDLAIVAGKPTALNGKLIWRDLGIDDDGIKLSIGDIQVDFTGNQQQYDFKVSDLDASLDVDGKGEIGADGQYRLDVKVRSETGMEPQVRSVLNLVATKVGLDNYRIEHQGRLPPHLTRQLFP